MHLTRMAINTRRRGARILLASPQAMHAAVLAGFPPKPGSGHQEGRVLWRLDAPAAHAVNLWVASPDRPDLTHLVEQAGWPTTAAWETREYGPLLDRLAAGQVWAFRLRANPVHSVRLREGSDTQPAAHVTADQQLTWLLDRAERLGIEMVTAEDGTPRVAVRDRATHRFPRRGATVTIAQATFDGTLRVVDPDRLRAALVGGVGRAKAYGCGLLTLAPVT